MLRKIPFLSLFLFLFYSFNSHAADFPKPYEKGATKRESIFEFTQKPAMKYLGEDQYEISFSVKGFCDVTVSIINTDGKVVRHLASGVLGKNAPTPFQKNTKDQSIIWNGKNDFGDYPKEPEKLSIRVSLGMKPTYDKTLGWHKKNLIGEYFGIAAGPDAVYVLSGQHPQLRRHDRDGNYVKTVFPPSPNVSLDKFKGLETIEYEKGKRTLISGEIRGLPVAGRFISTVFGYGKYWPGGSFLPSQVALMGQWFVYGTFNKGGKQIWFYRVNTQDGSSDDKSYAWGMFSSTEHFRGDPLGLSKAKTALSPDKKTLYVSGLQMEKHPAVYQLKIENDTLQPKALFAGDPQKYGQGNNQFITAEGIACDSAGNVYVCDEKNNRIQIFTSKGEYKNTIKTDKPFLIRVHPKTGAIYILQSTRSKSGRGSGLYLTKLKSTSDPSVTAQYSLGVSLGRKTSWEPLLTLDHYSKSPRIWMTTHKDRLLIMEDQGNAFQLIRDFKKDADDITASTKMGSHSVFDNGGSTRISADPIREEVYVSNYYVWDLKTGKYLRKSSWPKTDDVDFDKRGFVYVHLNPGSAFPAVIRQDPGDSTIREGMARYREIPFDYGKAVHGYKGILPVRDQPGGHFFQHGMDVTMRGDVAEVACCYYLPKGTVKDTSDGFVNKSAGSKGGHSYEDFLMRVKKLQQGGADVYSIKRKPGRWLTGSTIWVFDWTGEIRSDNIIPGLLHTNGVGVDEDGAVYTVFRGTRMKDGKRFLYDNVSIIGNSGKKAMGPFTGTLIKAPAAGADILRAGAPVEMDPPPNRPKDFVWGRSHGWVENAEWMYAGASPIVEGSCICPALRICTYWYKRTFVPEGYRHSVGIVDTAGNLIMHLGKYGNADSGRGPDSPIKVGGDEITLAHVMSVTATDNYIALSDSANERVTILKINYHANETIPIKTQ